MTAEHLSAEQIADQLIELHVRQDDARRTRNWEEAERLDQQIHALEAKRNALLARSHRT